MPRIALNFFTFPLFVAILLAEVSAAQSAVPQADSGNVPPALVRSAQMVPGQQGPALEILATRPLTPDIILLENPTRLVIDLPKSYLGPPPHILYRDEKVSGVRINQFQKDPPIVRIVIDLLKTTAYSWDGAGNRLTIRLYRSGEAPAQAAAPSTPAYTQGVAPASSVGMSVTGSVVMSGNKTGSGSSVTAGSDVAILHMARGGEVKVCPGTTISVTSSKNGKEVMLGMSTGALETHYRLDDSSDSVLTPDFRILLAGPGEFHYAISADSRGNTCVRTLPGNTASVVISELIGDGTYQVKPAEQVVFRGGHLNSPDRNIPADCGCIAQSVPVLRAATPAAQSPAVTEAPRSLDKMPDSSSVPQSGVVPPAPETASLPPTNPNQPHVQVDAPFVFRASDPPPAPAPISSAELPPLRTSQQAQAVEVTVLPPPRPVATPAATKPPSKPGFFGKIKGFFSGIFR